MRPLHGAFEQTIFCQVARELQLCANGKRRSGPHATPRLTQVNHGAGDGPPASPDLAVPLDDQPDGLPLVAHGLTITRIGVGLNPLQGFRVCGQFEMTASVSISNCPQTTDRKSTRLNSSHDQISYAVFCLKKKKKHKA